MSCDRKGRSVEYALEEGPSYDHGEAVINAALDEQTLDLDIKDDLDVSLISIDKKS